MSERWVPERGETYYFVDSLGHVSSYTWVGDSVDCACYEFGNCFKTEAEAKAAAEKVKALLLSLHEKQPVTNCSQLPKLTAEVFDRSYFPKTAEYAVVTKDGGVTAYTHKPYINEEIPCWGFNRGCSFTVETAGSYDSSDWQNSLIERPSKLPEWCKPGAWIYTSSEQYLKINGISIDLQKIELSNEAIWSKQDIIDEAVSARIRPFNADEMKALVGKVLTSNSRSTPFSFLVVYAEGDGSFIESYRFKYTAEELKDHFTIDNKPCGVLEHLENGKWVE